jgi:hypothetical protein
MVPLATTEAKAAGGKEPKSWLWFCREVERAPLCGRLAQVLIGRGPKSKYCPKNGLDPWSDSSSLDWRMWIDYFLKK